MADSDRMENDETNIRITHKPMVGMQYKLVSLRRRGQNVERNIKDLEIRKCWFFSMLAIVIAIWSH